jgi:hypothetical protein
MVATLTIDRRFRGPRRSGNGGVSAGLAAGFLDGPATVHLRRPPPLDRPLRVVCESADVHIMDGDELVLRARPASERVEIETTVDHGLLQRTFDRGATPVPEDHPAPGCFVCGARDDGLGICPAALEGTDLWATVWIPERSVSSDGRQVDPHVVWGALDCPAGFAVVRAGRAPLTHFPALTELTVTLDHPVRVGQPVAVWGWSEGPDDHADGATAIIDADGVVCATGYARHALLPVDFAHR